MRADQVIIEPVLSEKSNSARESECKKYTFKVDPRANKFEIMAAVKVKWFLPFHRLCVTTAELFFALKAKNRTL